VKLANQLLVAINTVGVVEALVLATRAGADPRAVLEVLQTSFGGSAMLSRNVPLILERNFGLGTTIDLLAKDLGLIDELGETLAVRLLMGGQARQVFLEARAQGLGGADITALVRPLEALAGVAVAAQAAGVTNRQERQDAESTEERTLGLRNREGTKNAK